MTPLPYTHTHRSHASHVTLTPGLWEEFPDSGGPHLTEESTTVDRSEVREVAIEIQLLSYDSEPRALGRGGREGREKGKGEGGRGGEGRGGGRKGGRKGGEGRSRERGGRKGGEGRWEWREGSKETER